MPCLLKRPGPNSPGIITFTQNEALNGVPVTSRKVRSFVEHSVRERKWLFGIHLQGDCSNFAAWPREAWHSFIMWPDAGAAFLRVFKPQQIVPMNCINFMPDLPVPTRAPERSVDICVISRAGKVKRVVETLHIMRGLFDLKPEFKATIIVPDHRHFSEGERTYRLRDIDRRFFELPLQLFSSRELGNISFLCSPEESFGRFPLSNDLMTELLRRSKLMVLTSHLEGTPRVIAEALLTGTPCVLSKSLRTGIRSHLNPQNSLFIDDDIPTAVQQVHDALSHYDRFVVNLDEVRQTFCEAAHLAPLRGQLSTLIAEGGSAIEGEWYLDELHLRLPCHGQRHNSQFMNNENLFFDWLEKVQRLDPYSEDQVLGRRPLHDPAPFSPAKVARAAVDRLVQRIFAR